MANFDDINNFKWKKLISRRQKLISLKKTTVSGGHIFFEIGKVKFLKKKNKTLKDKNAAKNLKRDNVSAYVHVRRDSSSPWT